GSTSAAAAKVTTLRGAFGVTYGNAAPTATVRIDHGADVTAGNALEVAALATNTLSATTFVPAQGESANVSFSLGIGRASSLADIASGAVIHAGRMSVRAENTNVFANSAIAAGFGTSKDSKSST